MFSKYFCSVNKYLKLLKVGAEHKEGESLGSAAFRGMSQETQQGRLRSSHICRRRAGAVVSESKNNERSRKGSHCCQRTSKVRTVDHWICRRW